MASRIKLDSLTGCYRNHWPDAPGMRSVAEYDCFAGKFRHLEAQKVS